MFFFSFFSFFLLIHHFQTSYWTFLCQPPPLARKVRPCWELSGSLTSSLPCTVLSWHLLTCSVVPLPVVSLVSHPSLGTLLPHSASSHPWLQRLYFSGLLHLFSTSGKHRKLWSVSHNTERPNNTPRDGIIPHYLQPCPSPVDTLYLYSAGASRPYWKQSWATFVTVLLNSPGVFPLSSSYPTPQDLGHGGPGTGSHPIQLFGLWPLLPYHLFLPVPKAA